jgi:LysR family transcriptional regulator, benzoate and cis,cis-muconate-responsive activator of ben and cat genes
MELRHLRYFVAVAAEENVARAAAKLHVSAPGVSRQISDLEEELGILLLERSAKAVRLTEPGRVFLTGARVALKHVDRAVKAAQRKAKGLQGELHVAYSPSLVVDILPKALRQFELKFPGIRVVLHDFSTEEILLHLRDRKLDLALTIRPTGKLLRGLAFVELVRYALCVIASPSHRFGQLASVTLELLAREGIIGYNRKDYPDYHDLMAAVFKSTGRTPAISEQDSFASVVAEVEAGRGVAIKSVSCKGMLGPTIKILPFISPAPSIIVGALYRRGTVREEVEEFIAATSSELQAPVSYV